MTTATMVLAARLRPPDPLTLVCTIQALPPEDLVVLDGPMLRLARERVAVSLRRVAAAHADEVMVKELAVELDARLD